MREEERGRVEVKDERKSLLPFSLGADDYKLTLPVPLFPVPFPN